MKKLIFSLTCFMLSIATWAVENYPYRSDYLWVTVPDHADWLYKTGEQATVEVQFYKYGIPRDGIVEYGIGTDLMEDDTKGKAELKNGRCTIKMGHLQTLPYYDVVCFAPYVKAKTYLTWGFNDNTCPPTTSYAVWNLLQCEKESLITPVNEHWTSEATNRQQLDWILKNLK